MSIRRHVEALIHRARCDRSVLLPMLDKLTERELQALYHLVENSKDDAQRQGMKKMWGMR